MSISPDMDPHLPDMDARAVAERWFSRLRAADCSAAERMAFLQWRALPEHDAAYVQTEQLWKQIGALAQMEEMQAWSQAALRSGATQLSSPRKRMNRTRGMKALALATAAMLVLGVGALLSLQAPQAEPTLQEYAATDQLRTIELPDQSVVTLNVDSVVEAEYSETARVLHLRRGEAVFEVHSDPSRPFVVEAGLGEIRALGTRFMVRRQEQATTVTHLRGRIAVTSAGTEVLPEVGEQLRVYSSGKVERRKVDLVDVQSWMSGRLVFRATPLAEALDEVNRYAERQLRITDPALARMPISGTVVVGDSRTMARALAVLLDLDLQSSSEGDLLLAPKKS